MTTTEAIKHGAGTLADTATSALSDLADKASDLADKARPQRKQSHRGRVLLIGAALIGAAAAAFRVVRARMGGQDERVIDLTQDPVLVPETLTTP
jgi:hypothetical protein